MKNFILFALIIPFIFGCRGNATESNDSILTDYYNSSSIPAAVLGSIDADGNTTWHSYGPAIWEDSTSQVTEDNIFRIYSMTKAITSVAALQLVEKGLIGLDDPLNELLPEMAAIPILGEDGQLLQSEEAITLRQLLTHTSGFGLALFSSRLYNFHPEDWPYEDLPRLFQPGASFAYGTGLNWAGRVVEELSGQDLETYFREHITGPLQMNETWFNVPEELSEQIVTLGGRDSTGTVNIWLRIPEQPVTSYEGEGGLFGSPADYLTFLQCILNYGKYDGGQILKRETVELMMQDNLPQDIRPQIDQFDNGGFIGYSGKMFDNMKNDTWGFGWFIEQDNDDTRPLNAAYWAGAANSYYTIDMEDQIAIVCFSNFFPANDKEAFNFYKLYESEVFKNTDPN